MPKGSSLSGKMTVASSGNADPELENLLVSDQESANNTPAVSRKTTQPLHGTAGKAHSGGSENPSNPLGNPISIVDPLPPTANNEQLKALTGPKLRKAGAPPPGGGNKNQRNLSSTNTGGNGLVQQKNGQNQNISNKNNGSVASKEIQTSTISLLALASAAAQTQTTVSAGNNNSDLAQKFENFENLSDTISADNVFKCPNDMCRHNKVSSAMTTNSSGKRKICLCGRTMLNQNSLLNSQNTTGQADSVKETSKQHASTTEKFIP